jgi:radical SAM enzyme (TIGR01210 family)
MCDLWKHTIVDDTPRGAIPAQVDAAVRRFAAADSHHVKLYNAGSFFDARAVPPADYDAIARHVGGFTRVIVESHPALIGARVDRFLRSLNRQAAARRGPPDLEVAMGLETAHPDALRQLNKRMDVAMFRAAAAGLRRRGVSLRVFLLIAPPFVPPFEQDEWLLRSLDVALECGATTISLIPTRGGNGTMEVLSREQLFARPAPGQVQLAVARARAHVGGRVLVLSDPWAPE